VNTTTRNTLTLAAAVFCLTAGYIFILRPLIITLENMPMAEDVKKSASLYNYVTGRFHFDGKSLSNPKRPPVYCDPFQNSACLIVYGVTNAEAQDKVIMAMRVWQATNRNMAKLTVRFLNGKTGKLLAIRNPELPTRKAGGKI
jgi:hypothetical protein